LFNYFQTIFIFPIYPYIPGDRDRRTVWIFVWMCRPRTRTHPPRPRNGHGRTDVPFYGPVTVTGQQAAIY